MNWSPLLLLPQGTPKTRVSILTSPDHAFTGLMEAFLLPGWRREAEHKSLGPPHYDFTTRLDKTLKIWTQVLLLLLMVVALVLSETHHFPWVGNGSNCCPVWVCLTFLKAEKEASSTGSSEISFFSFCLPHEKVLRN